MPESARILKFPSRDSFCLSREEAVEQAKAFLLQISIRIDSPTLTAVSTNPDVLVAVCNILGEGVDEQPELTLTAASQLYRTIAATPSRLGALDERDYFLGETALLSAKASRFLGKRSDADSWLNRADAQFRNTVNPTPQLSRVTYQRLALQFEIGQYEEVAELASLLVATFCKCGMSREAIQCRYLEANALKHSGQIGRAGELLEQLGGPDVAAMEPYIAGMALTSLGDLHASNSADDLATEAYSRALPLVNKAQKPAASAFLKHAMAETFLRRGAVRESIAAYSSALEEYVSMGTATYIAYLRVELANAMIQGGMLREAEWQILAALPTIDEQRMVPQGFAALTLLAESARRRSVDRTALATLRDHLKANR